MGADIHLYVERRAPTYEVPHPSFLSSDHQGNLRALAELLDNGEIAASGSALAAMLDATIWRPLFLRDPHAEGPDQLLRSRILEEANFYGYCERDYLVFGVLAGVRISDVPRVADPRGLPCDLSPEIRREHGDCVDWHTPSWLLLDELNRFDWDQPLPREYRGVGDTLRHGCHRFLDTTVRRLNELSNPSDIRIVYWFDN